MTRDHSLRNETDVETDELAEQPASEQLLRVIAELGHAAHLERHRTADGRPARCRHAAFASNKRSVPAATDT